MKRTIGVATFLASTAVMASDTTIRVGEDAISLYFNPQLSETNSMQFALVHNNDVDTTLFSAGIFANGVREELSGRLGGKVYYVDLDRDSGYGIALGGDLSLRISPRLNLNAGLYYGPGSLSFSDVDGYEEWFIRLNYEVFDNATLGAGFSSVEIEPERFRDVELEDGFFIEMSLRF